MAEKINPPFTTCIIKPPSLDSLSPIQREVNQFREIEELSAADCQ